MLGLQGDSKSSQTPGIKSVVNFQPKFERKKTMDIELFIKKNNFLFEVSSKVLSKTLFVSISHFYFFGDFWPAEILKKLKDAQNSHF